MAGRARSAAIGGQLPDWAAVSDARRAHIARVAALMTEWADALQLAPVEKKRWVAAAFLHDALRDEDPAKLRALLGSDFADWPPPLLHGPAAATRLAADGLDDAGLLRAVAYHTVGHPQLDTAGRALYLADFLEPGRTFAPHARAVLRARMPQHMPAVLRAVVARRIGHMIAGQRVIRSETLSFWNEIVASQAAE